MSAADRPRALQAAAAVAVLPHELAHALPAAAAGLRPEITVLPAYEGDATPLGRFAADVSRSVRTTADVVTVGNTFLVAAVLLV